MDLVVKGIIELVSKGRGAQEAAAEMRAAIAAGKQLGAGLRETEKEAKRASEAFAGLGRSITGYISVAAIGSLVRGAVTEFSTLQRSLNAIASDMEALGISSAENMPKVREMLEGLGEEKLAGTTTAFQKFLGITRDVEAAMYATALAVDVSERKNIEAAEAAEMLAQVMQGRASMAATRLGVQLRGMSGEAASADEILGKVIETSEGFASKADDTQERLNKLAATWVRFKLDLGEGLAALIVPMDWLYKSAKSLGTAIVAPFVIAIQGIKNIAALIGSLFDPEQLAKGPRAFFEHVKDVAVQGGESMKDVLRGIGDAYVGIWKEKGQEAGEKGAEAEALARQKVLDIAHRAEVEKQKKAAEEAEKVRLDALRSAGEKIVAEMERTLQRREAIEAASAQRVLELQARQYADGSDAKLASEITALEARYDAEIEAASNLGADTTALRLAKELEANALILDHRREHLDSIRSIEEELITAYDEARAAAFELEIADRERMNQATFDLQLEAIEKQAEANIEAAEDERDRVLADIETTEEEKALAVQLAENKILAIRKRAATASIQITHAEAAAKTAAMVNAASVIVGMARNAFGQNKAIAIAQATIDAYQSYNSVMKDPAVPAYAKPILAGAILGLALAQVAKIVSTDIGSGPGGGASGAPGGVSMPEVSQPETRIATWGEQGWTPSTLSPDSQIAGSDPTKTEPTTVFNLTVNGLYGGNAGLVDLQRELDRVASAVSSRRIGG